MLHHRSLVTKNTDKLSEHGVRKHRFSLSQDVNDGMMMMTMKMMVMMTMMMITMKTIMMEVHWGAGEGVCLFWDIVFLCVSPKPQIFQAFLNASFKLLSFKLPSQD